MYVLFFQFFFFIKIYNFYNSFNRGIYISYISIGIIEFFWFQSSIDRGSDFYVAVIKARASPGDNCYWGPWLAGADCHLWADELQDWGEYPVISVEAMTDISREAGAFRWDWSVPFENYGNKIFQ